MSTKQENQEAVADKPGEETKPLFEASRRVLLAAIGAVALAQDEIEDFVNKLVERGEIAEKDGKKLVREVMDHRSKTTREVEVQAGKLLQEAMKRMNIPSRKDLDEISEKIAALTIQINELSNKQ